CRAHGVVAMRVVGLAKLAEYLYELAPRKAESQIRPAVYRVRACLELVLSGVEADAGSELAAPRRAERDAAITSRDRVGFRRRSAGPIVGPSSAGPVRILNPIIGSETVSILVVGPLEGREGS